MTYTTDDDGSTAPDRPACRCGKYGPTINGRCPEHMDIRTEGLLMTVSAEDALAYLAAQPEPKPGL